HFEREKANPTQNENCASGVLPRSRSFQRGTLFNSKLRLCSSEPDPIYASRRECRQLLLQSKRGAMNQYNFKKITVVPNANDLIGIILSRTERRTPTIVHKGYPIDCIRPFYMLKVQSAQMAFHHKLSTIIDEFPIPDNIHHFYNNGHYKLALEQINTARNLISRIAEDYLKLLTYGDSLHRCKTLKNIALARMCTVIKRIGPSLAYLEQVRQHMARLPWTDIPNGGQWNGDLLLPVFLDVYNVYEFVDPDILLRVEELEREEGIRQGDEEDEMELDQKLKKIAAESRRTVPEFTYHRMGRQLSKL
ncbi:Nucleolar GTP-binding protein 1, partial [Linum grandiflorum]